MPVCLKQRAKDERETKKGRIRAILLNIYGKKRPQGNPGALEIKHSRTHRLVWLISSA